MRGAFFWMASTALAFAATAAVFLILAQIGTSPPQRNLSADGERRSDSGQPLSLEFQRSTLESLREAEDQALGITLSNGISRDLTDINVYLILSSEDTAKQDTRYYEAEIKSLDSGESKTARFKLDLSPPGNAGEDPQGSQDADSFSILEVRAASSEGASTVKTAVLSF